MRDIYARVCWVKSMIPAKRPSPVGPMIRIHVPKTLKTKGQKLKAAF